MLHINKLCTHFAEQSLCFSLTSNKGQITALIGPSGAGKSTLLAMIAGFIKTDSGTLTYQQHDLLPLLPAKRPITSLFQDNNLFWHLTVYQNIAIGLAPSLRLTAQQQTLVTEVATQLGIDNLLNRTPNSLSGGQQQRVGLARSLARRQPILLLDEPFSALDPALRLELLTLLRQQTDQLNLTVLMVTHHPEEAARIADNMAFICDGSILETGDKTLLTHPKSAALKRYLGQKNE